MRKGGMKRVSLGFISTRVVRRALGLHPLELPLSSTNLQAKTDISSPSPTTTTTTIANPRQPASTVVNLLRNGGAITATKQKR